MVHELIAIENVAMSEHRIGVHIAPPSCSGRIYHGHLIAAPLAAFAQADSTELDVQKMMQAAQEMERCMKSLDQGALESLEQESRQFEADAKKLCQSGQRDEAQARALKFGREMAAAPGMQKMQECSETMLDLMPQFAPQLDLLTEEELREKHICDEF